MDIKKREHKKDIKLFDRAGLLSEKMKNGYIRSRDFVRKQTEQDEEKPEDKLQKASSDIAYKSVNAAHEAGKRLFVRSRQKLIKQKLKNNIKKSFKGNENKIKDIKKIDFSPNDIKTRDKSGYVKIKTRDYNASKPKRAKIFKRTIKIRKQSNSAVDKGRELAKKQYIKHTQMQYLMKNREVILSHKASNQLKTAQEIKQNTGNLQNQITTKTLNDKPLFNKMLSNHLSSRKRAIKTKKGSDIRIKKVKDRLKIKQKPQKIIKSTGKTIKTSEQTAKVTVKTSQQTVKAVSKSSVSATKTAKHTAFLLKQLAINTAKTGVAVSKSLAKASVAAIKATAAGMKSLIAALAAGGWVAVLIILIFVVICGAVCLVGDVENSSYTPVSDEVNAYKPIIRIYAEEHGIPDYIELIKAVMMQESGGRGNDPMQASECGFNTRYPNTPNGITDPEYSINVGIQNLAACLSQANVQSPIDMENIKLALQGYNYGNGYISWALENYGGYSYANAVEFSEMMAERLGWSNYGDKQYVPHVLRYYPYGRGFTGIGNRVIVEIALSQVGNVGGEPYWSWYGFGSRVEWCACFVSWCANEAGYIDAGSFPRFSACTSGEAWFKEKGQWQDSTYEPKSGDIIFFDWQGDGRTDHVGIVDRVENGIIYTVEGNSGDACKQNDYPLGDEDIYGFGVLYI